ncbi:hypothetical protein MJD09_27110 [bacterium]|nr:hypothetical protein [bacterium]
MGKSQLLDEFYQVTMDLSRLLNAEDFDQAIKTLERRDVLLNSIKEQKDWASLSSKKSNIKSILELDRKNIALLNKKIKETQEAIVTLEKEKESVSNLRSLSKINQKQIVDFVY